MTIESGGCQQTYSELFPQPGNADIPCITGSKVCRVSWGIPHSSSTALASVQVVGNDLRTTPRVPSLGIVTSSRNSQALNTFFSCCFTTLISFLAQAALALSSLGPGSAGYKLLQSSLATGLVLALQGCRICPCPARFVAADLLGVVFLCSGCVPCVPLLSTLPTQISIFYT